MNLENVYDLPSEFSFHSGGFNEASELLRKNKALALVMKLKDVPTERPSHIVAAALLPRTDPAFYLLNKLPTKNLALLGSTQKLYHNYNEIQLYLKEINPKISCEKIQEEELANKNLAIHVGDKWTSEPLIRLSPQEFIPPTSEGIMVILCHSDNIKLRKKAGKYHDDDCYDCSNIERQIQREMSNRESLEYIASYVYKDDSANYHATLSYLDDEKLIYVTHSQSTTFDLAEQIISSIF